MDLSIAISSPSAVICRARCRTTSSRSCPTACAPRLRSANRPNRPPLTEAEQSELLKQRGHPWLMASRYLPQQYLIGPALFPYYRQALTMVVFWVVLPITLVRRRAYARFTPTTQRNVGTGAGRGVERRHLLRRHRHHRLRDSRSRERVRFTALDNWNPAACPPPARGASCRARRR